MQSMLLLAESEDIKVHFYAFCNPLKGIYMADESLPAIIGLDHSLKDDLPLIRSVMAEELGHHFTSAGNALTFEFFNYSDRMKVSKIEYKALRWAANYLISDNDLMQALQEGLYEPCELAEYFQVVPELIQVRLKLFEKAILC